MTDVFTLLTEDHRKVEGLFAQFQQTSDPNVALEICQELTVHAVLEEELVYPMLATKVDVGLAQEAREEHRQAKELISRIESGVGNGDDVSDLVQQLEEAVQHHVEEEETEVFPTMQQKLPDLVNETGPDYVERKEQLLAKMADAMDRNQPPSLAGEKATNTPGN
jgi:hemerythrin superfamily protein